MRIRSHPLLLAFAPTCLVLGACSERAEDVAADTSDSTRSRGDDQLTAPANVEGPGLTVPTASRVAFRYRYAFSLPSAAISRVQQRHAAACEQLGARRCQIVGMAYEQPDENEVSARLDLLLAPELAQRFGSDAILAVESAKGSVETAHVLGEDAGGAIEESQRQTIALQAALSRIEKRLQAKGIGAGERADLLRRANELRSEIGAGQHLRVANEAALAMTPVSFDYGTEGLFTSGGNPIAKAAAVSLSSFETMFSVLLAIGAIALPWLLVFAIVVLLVRLRRLQRRLAVTVAEGSAQTSPEQG